jgi:deoxyribodipyrimidine photolyase
MIKKVNFFCFRRDLRLDDNIGLDEALNSNSNVIPLFIFDENITNELEKNDPRINFIYNQLESINKCLESKYNSRLLVLKGKPLDVIKKRRFKGCGHVGSFREDPKVARQIGRSAQLPQGPRIQGFLLWTAH